MSAGVTNAQWYAVQARSNFEHRICKDLELRGVESYCPAIQEMHQWADRKKEIERPVFPGYVLAHFSDSAAVRLRILQSAGAVRILGSAGKIEPIPNVEVESIKTALASGSVCARHPFLRDGARVRVRRGVLRDAEGILVRSKNDARLVLSLNLFSRSISTEVDLNDVEPLPASLS